MKVLLETGVWLADGDGDPARTLVEENAREFDSTIKAYKALKDARKYRPFPNAELTEEIF